MSRYNYTSVHDLKDIFNIYEDCPDYDLRFWNYKDSTYMNVCFSGIKYKTDKQHGVIKFYTEPKAEGNKFMTISQFKDIVLDLIDICLEMGENVDDYEVLLYDENQVEYKATFSGSCHSGDEKYVSYSVWCNNNKKNKLKRFFGKIKKLFK